MNLRKFVVEVIETKEVEVWLDTDQYGETFLKEFSESMFKVDDISEVVRSVAFQAATSTGSFIEGLGDWPKSWQREKNIEELGYHVNVTEVDVELEFKEEV